MVPNKLTVYSHLMVFSQIAQLIKGCETTFKHNDFGNSLLKGHETEYSGHNA